MSQREELMRIAEAVAKDAGVELYWIKYQNAPGYQRLQVLIDKAGGVSVSDCERVSRALGEPFDEQIHHRYELEVSSPGLDRPLFTPDHYAKALGHQVQVKCNVAIQEQRVWSGKLILAQNASITLQTSKGLVEILLDQIAHAQVIPDFDLS